MNRTIYVVTQGAYSDYRISAVFDDKELADLYLAALGGTKDAEIEEYELNPLAPILRAGTLPYRVCINNENATVRTLYPLLYFKEDQIHTGMIVVFEEYLEIDVIARNPDHAAKIAMEQRAIWLANTL